VGGGTDVGSESLELEAHAVILLWVNSHAVLQLIKFSMEFG